MTTIIWIFIYYFLSRVLFLSFLNYATNKNLRIFKDGYEKIHNGSNDLSKEFLNIKSIMDSVNIKTLEQFIENQKLSYGCILIISLIPFVGDVIFLFGSTYNFIYWTSNLFVKRDLE